MTLQAWLEIWLTTYIDPLKAPSTGAGYRQALKKLQVSFLGQNLADVAALEVQREINRIGATTPRQAQICLVALRSALKRARQHGYIVENPAAEIEQPNIRKKEAAYLDAAALRALLDASEGTRSYRAILLMAALGLRRGEALGLQYGDLIDGHARIRRQLTARGVLAELKTPASRRVLALPEDLRAALGDGAPGDQVCAVSPSKLRRDLNKAAAAAQCGHVTPHMLRHTFASLAISSGVQMRVLQSLMGHAHFDVTADTYSHVYRPDMDAAAKIIYARMQTPNHLVYGVGARLEIV